MTTIYVGAQGKKLPRGRGRVSLEDRTTWTRKTVTTCAAIDLDAYDTTKSGVFNAGALKQEFSRHFGSKKQNSAAKFLLQGACIEHSRLTLWCRMHPNQWLHMWSRFFVSKLCGPPGTHDPSP